MFVFAGLIGLFPKYLPKKKEENYVDEYEFGKAFDHSAEIVDNSDEDVSLKSKCNGIVCLKL